MWKEGKVGPLPCMELAIAEGVRGIPRRLYGGRDPWIGWGMGVAMEAVLVPRALKDCGCWNPGKVVEEDTQELRDRLSDVVKAEPASKEKECLTFALQHTKLVKEQKGRGRAFHSKADFSDKLSLEILPKCCSLLVLLLASCCPWSLCLRQISL